MRRHQGKSGIALAAVLLGLALAPAASAATPDRRDITETRAGRAAAAEAAGRFRGYGVASESRSLRVVTLPDGSQVVGPRSYTVAELARLGEGGSVSTRAVNSEAASPAPALAAAAPPYWLERSSRCFSRTYFHHGDLIRRNVGWMDTCYQIHKLMNDANATSDFWNIHAWATFDATNSGSWAFDAWIHVDRDGGPTWSWYDWKPRSEITGNCRDYALSVAYAGAALGFSHDTCETWTPTKYTAPGTMKVMWTGSTQAPREVALMTAIKTPNGSSSPIWGISWNATMRCLFEPCPSP